MEIKRRMMKKCQLIVTQLNILKKELNDMKFNALKKEDSSISDNNLLGIFFQFKDFISKSLNKDNTVSQKMKEIEAKDE